MKVLINKVMNDTGNKKKSVGMNISLSKGDYETLTFWGGFCTDDRMANCWAINLVLRDREKY